jgi:hypothetical protein
VVRQRVTGVAPPTSSTTPTLKRFRLSAESRGFCPDDNAGHLVRPVTSLTITESFDIAFPLHPTDAVERRTHHTDRSS